MTTVKICGVRSIEDALFAAGSGADFIGLVFAPSRRRVSVEEAKLIAHGLGPLRRQTKLVGVFVNEWPSEVNRIARVCELDYVQLSGDEPDELLEGIDRPVIRAMRIANGAMNNLEERLASCQAELVLLDKAHRNAYGGTGKPLDWHSLPSLSDRRVLLSGGLNPANVSTAIEILQPWGVDVSSGVETAGRKDQAKIRDFIAATRVNGNGRRAS